MISTGLLLLMLAADEAIVTSTLTFTLTATDAPDAPVATDHLQIEGNRVLPAPVYRSLVRLPNRWPPTRRALERAALQLEEFLHDAGYLLARVEAKLDGDRATFVIDEGRLERITFPGQVGLGALRLQLELDLPGDVFNRPDLEEQLHRFEVEHGLKVQKYRLVRSKVEGGEVQIQSPFEVRGVPVLPEQGQFELQIFTEEPELPPGVHLEADGRPADGLRVRLKYRMKSVLLDDDRLELGAEVGVRVQDFLGAPKTRRKISRAALGAIVYSPRIGGMPLRLLIWPEVRWHSRQRLDLEIQTYDFLWADPTLLLMVSASDDIDLSFGGGVEYQRLLSVERTGTTELVEPYGKPQPFLALSAELRAGGTITRLDEQHRIKLDVRQVLALERNWRTSVRAAWEKTFPLGFEELRLGAQGMGVFGRVAFTDEDRVGDSLRGGLFGEQIYCDRSATALVEFRWSLFRELYKIGIFHDGAICHSGLDGKVRLADSFGVGLHALLLNTFRLSIYVAQGFAAGGLSDQGFSIALTQVF